MLRITLVLDTIERGTIIPDNLSCIPIMFCSQQTRFYVTFQMFLLVLKYEKTKGELLVFVCVFLQKWLHFFSNSFYFIQSEKGLQNTVMYFKK